MIPSMKMYSKLFYQTKLDFVRAYTEIGKETACDNPLF